MYCDDSTPELYCCFASHTTAQTRDTLFCESDCILKIDQDAIISLKFQKEPFVGMSYMSIPWPQNYKFPVAGLKYLLTYNNELFSMEIKGEDIISKYICTKYLVEIKEQQQLLCLCRYM